MTSTENTRTYNVRIIGRGKTVNRTYERADEFEAHRRGLKTYNFLASRYSNFATRSGRDPRIEVTEA